MPQHADCLRHNNVLLPVASHKQNGPHHERLHNCEVGSSVSQLGEAEDPQQYPVLSRGRGVEHFPFIYRVKEKERCSE